MEETINGTSVSLIRSWIFYLLDLIEKKDLDFYPRPSSTHDQQLKPEVVLILKIIQKTFNGEFTWGHRGGSHPIWTDERNKLKEQLELILKIIEVRNP